MRRLGLLFVLALFGMIAMQAASMSSLLGGGTVTCGNLTFANFRGFSSVASGGAVAPIASEIFIEPDTANCSTYAPGPGVLVQSANWNVNAGQTIDTAFTFDVIAPWALITDARLSLQSFDSQNGGAIHVTESLFDAQNNNIVNLSVDSLTGPIIDSHVFTSGPYSFITVNKDIALEGHANGTASLSTSTQNFSQVPEPPSALMAGFVLAGLALRSLLLRK